VAPQASPIRLNYAKALIKAGKKDEARSELDQLAKLGDKFPAQAEVTARCRRISVGLEVGRSGGPGRGRLHHRRRADAGRRCASAGFRTAGRRVETCRSPPEARCDRRIRIDRLSRRDRRSVHSDHREVFGPEVEEGFLRRLFAGAHQSGRQGADGHQDRQGGVRRFAGNPAQGHRPLRSVITAGVYPASSIKVAEAAKVIENTQRDLNIALMNELAIIFRSSSASIPKVLQAAGTKWNFLPFRPGLVGGHCIGVDPYYLTHKAEMLGYHPQVISPDVASMTAWANCRRTDGQAAHSQRRIGQGCQGDHRARSDLQGGLPGSAQLARHRRDPRTGKLRGEVLVHDPVADTKEAEHEYGVSLHAWEDLPQAGCHRCSGFAQGIRRKAAQRFRVHAEARWRAGRHQVQFDAAALRAQGVSVWRL
jgi:hypothetical protein